MTISTASNGVKALTVEPFEWKNETYKSAFPQRRRAITPICEYSVAGSDGKENWRWFRNGYHCGPGSLIERSMEGAMDAAFEHHVATVRSCLSPIKPSAETRDRKLAEAVA